MHLQSLATLIILSSYKYLQTIVGGRGRSHLIGGVVNYFDSILILECDIFWSCDPETQKKKDLTVTEKFSVSDQISCLSLWQENKINVYNQTWYLQKFTTEI